MPPPAPVKPSKPPIANPSSINAHVLDGFQYPVSVTLTFVLACTVGMLIGRSLMHRIDSNKVQKIFATTVVGVAMYLIYSALMG